MMIIVKDEERSIMVTLHNGGPLTTADVDTLVAEIERTAERVSKSSKLVATSLVIVDTDHGPNAGQRKRIGDAAKKIPRSIDTLVTRSAVTRAIMTAIRWIAPADANRIQSTHATYEEARAFLVERTGHAASVFDAMHRQVQDQARKAG